MHDCYTQVEWRNKLSVPAANFFFALRFVHRLGCIIIINLKLYHRRRMDDISCYNLRWTFNFGSTKHRTRSHGQNCAYHLHSFSRIQQQHNGNTTRTLIFILLSAILLIWLFISNLLFSGGIDVVYKEEKYEWIGTYYSSRRQDRDNGKS